MAIKVRVGELEAETSTFISIQRRGEGSLPQIRLGIISGDRLQS